MRLQFQERRFSAMVIILAVIVVIALGVLQYRWSDQVSEATSIRLADSLQMSMINWHLDLFRAFSGICLGFDAQPNSQSDGSLNRYARRYRAWKAASPDSHLIAGVYVAQMNPAAARQQLMHLNDSTGQFERADWPTALVAVHQALQEAGTGAAPSIYGSNPAKESPGNTPDREIGGLNLGDALAGWRFESDPPALVRRLENGPSSTAAPPPRDSADWLVIALDRSDLRSNVLPALAQRYFRGTEGLDYEIAVAAGNREPSVLYASDPGFGSAEVRDADGTMDIFARDIGGESPIHVFHTPSPDSVPAASSAISWFPLLGDLGPDRDWRLIVRHRRGGALGAFVADSRRRDLAISFGVLSLLVASMAILIVTSMRAQRVAKLQMDFVTAVSHELRTPLTVISSAAENISHGVVQGKAQLEQYGSVIGAQARKLFEMVEQILMFAAIREGQQRYSIRPLRVEQILESALAGTAGLIRTATFHVEQNIQPDLPQISGDAAALTQCVQNLITNALKYGNERKWIGIEARFAEHGLTGKEVQISVSDRGIGISPEEVRHIFEPFYRSPGVMAAQIHGTGLGLPLAKSIVEAMKGQITVKSAPGRGSTFTLHLPSLEPPLPQAESKATEVLSS